VFEPDAQVDVQELVGLFINRDIAHKTIAIANTSLTVEFATVYGHKPIRAANESP
jgi:hypothetical protein